MAWYLERQGAAATRVNLVPIAGDIEIEYPQNGAEYDALDGTRVVWQSPAGKLRITIPPLHFSDRNEVTRLRNLITTGARLTLSTDTGETYTVRALNGVQVTILDTPDRGTAPKHRVRITLVGV